MQIIDSWLSDLPQQFLGKDRIYAVIKAFSKQLQEIQCVFDDLNNLTDIDNAIGQNLDMVGNIVSLTRKDATAIIRRANDDVLTDDIYRQTLRYKILKNSSDCTYEDIMGAVSLLRDTRNIAYKEPPERPATVLLSIPTVSLDSIDPAVGRVLAIKSSGVAIIYTVGYWGTIPLYLYEKFFVPRMNLLWKVAFYDFAMKDVKKLNGAWLLDGSVFLNGALIEVPTRMKNHGISAAHSESIEMDCIAISSFASMDKISLPKTSIRFEVMENHKILRLFDGTWNLDGEYMLNEQQWYIPSFMNMYIGRLMNNEHGKVSDVAARCVATNDYESVLFCSAGNSTEIILEQSVNSRANIITEIDCKENISCSLVTKKNIWYLNGSQLLDGNRCLNAIEIKEVI